MLTPAACYPVYPLVAQRGRVPDAGLLFDVACDCFRHEPSRQLDRLQSFRMREFVCIGAPDQVIAFRTQWMARAPEIADLLGLQYKTEPASDPFFGRGGKLMATAQIEQSLKFELLIPVRSAEQPTACMSFNYHRDHFGTTWDLQTAAGEVRPHRLRRLRHGPPGGRAVLHARARTARLAGASAAGAVRSNNVIW